LWQVMNVFGEDMYRADLPFEPYIQIDDADLK